MQLSEMDLILIMLPDSIFYYFLCQLIQLLILSKILPWQIV